VPRGGRNSFRHSRSRTSLVGATPGWALQNGTLRAPVVRQAVLSWVCRARSCCGTVAELFVMAVEWCRPGSVAVRGPQRPRNRIYRDSRWTEAGLCVAWWSSAERALQGPLISVCVSGSSVIF
jgi:hypothetical protein